MNRRIGRILELLRNEVVGVLGDQLLRLADSAGHPFGRRCQYQFGSQRLEHTTAFEAHAFRHGDHQAITASSTDIGQTDPRVATGRLNDHGILTDLAILFRRLDHGSSDSILHAPEGIHVLDFADHRGTTALRHTSKLDQRRVSNASGDVTVDPSAIFAAHINFPVCT